MLIQLLRKRIQFGFILLDYLLLLIFLLPSIRSSAQTATGFVKGKVYDGSTFRELTGVAVGKENSSSVTNTAADGSYQLTLPTGNHSVSFKIPGFKGKLISMIAVNAEEITYLDIFLYPSMDSTSDTSAIVNSSLFRNSFRNERSSGIYQQLNQSKHLYDFIPEKNIQPGTDKDGSQLLKRLNGVIVADNFPTQNYNQSLNIFGMGSRYNQVLFNGAVLNSFNPLNRTYPFMLFPSELIENVSVQKTGNSAIPADYAGGNLSIQMKDFPEQNFFYLLGGIGYSDETKGKDFYSDKRSSTEFLGLPGAIRDLPAGFPTTRSQYSLAESNPQEQVFLSKKLNNNLGPINEGPSGLNDKIVVGFGRRIRLKKGEQIGIVAYLSHHKSELISESITQAVPDVAGNPYPFDPGKVLIKSLSNNVSYSYASQLGAALNGTILFGKSKISWKNFFASQVLNTGTERTHLYKPDEDTLAHYGVHYLAEERKLYTTQVSGEHVLAANNKLKINWLASYTYYRQRNPDERSFLLKPDSANDDQFEIASPSVASLSSVDAMFTNSGRLWRDLTDHNFTGSLGLQFPFELFKRDQVLSGGIYIQTLYRILYSDFLIIQGPGYYTLENMLSPDRYYPGGLTVSNFYTKFFTPSGIINPAAINATHRGNYTGSSNTGAAYMRMENYFTNRFSINWGFRLESNSHLVSTSQYNYFEGYKNAQLVTLDENDKVITTNLLPSLELNYRPAHSIRFHVAYFKTVSRPLMQELSRFRYYDALSYIVKTGNPLLGSSDVQNFDGGIDWTPDANAQISVAGIYKKLNQPIEYIVSGYVNSKGNLFSVPHNAPPATVKGLAASLKVSLGWISNSLSNISLFGNGNWLQAKVESGPIRSLATPSVQEHSLSGIPEFSFNGGMVINYPRLPMVTLLYSRTTDYITALGSGRTYDVGNGNSVMAIPYYRLKGRNQLDLQISQKLFKSRLQIVAGANNLTKDDYVEYQDLNGNEKFDMPLMLSNRNGSGGFYLSGTDNTVVSLKTQRTYYLTLSYLFK